MVKKVRKKSQKEKPLKVNMNADDLLGLLAKTKPEHKKGKKK